MIFTGRPTWMEQAACRDIGPDEFYKNDRTSSPGSLAERLCAICPVRTECLDYALTLREDYGYWGGTTPEERRAIRRSRRAPSAPGRRQKRTEPVCPSPEAKRRHRIEGVACAACAAHRPDLGRNWADYGRRHKNDDK